MGIVVGIVLVAAIVLLGGGNTLKGLGSDLKTTGTALESNINGRPPLADTPPQLPATSSYTYAEPASATPHSIPAAEESR